MSSTRNHSQLLSKSPQQQNQSVKKTRVQFKTNDNQVEPVEQSFDQSSSSMPRIQSSQMSYSVIGPPSANGDHTPTRKEKIQKIQTKVQDYKQPSNPTLIDLFSSQIQGHNIESHGDSAFRNHLNPFLAHSPQKKHKESIEGTNLMVEERTNIALQVEKGTASAIKVRLQQHQDSPVKQPSSLLVDEKQQYFKAFFNEQRNKIKMLLGSVDQKMWTMLEADLKVTLQDPFIRAEQVIQSLNEEEERLNQYLEDQNMSKIHKFERKKNKIMNNVFDFQQELQNFKSFIYFSKKLKVHDSIYRQMSDQNQHLKDYITLLVQDLKQEHAKDALQVHRIEEQYKSDVKLPVQQLGHDLEEIKRSHNDLAQIIKKQKPTADLETQINNVALEVDKIKTASALREDQLKKVNSIIEQLKEKIEFGNQKFDIVHKECESNEQKIEKMHHELQQYIKGEEDRRTRNWRVDFGEEAKIETENNIQTMLHLHNKTVAVASQSADKENNLIEIYDQTSDFEKISTIYTFHTARINCLAEHRKMLLSGSEDSTIGMWDLSNNFQLLHQYRQNNDEHLTSLLSIDQRYFLTGCSKGSIKIWDSVTHQLSFNKLNAHEQKINMISSLSKFRVASCSKDKIASVWQLQGSTMTKVVDLPHNSSVISAIDIVHNDQILTCTHQGYVFIWNLGSSKSGPNKPLSLYKFESEKLISLQSMIDYDYRLFPFIVAQSSEGEIMVMQLTTGKSQRLKYKSLLAENHHQFNFNIEGSQRMIQTDSNNLLVSSDQGHNIRILLIEFENLKEGINIMSQ